MRSTILVVDDDPTHHVLVADAFSSVTGITVLHAMDGIEALAVVDSLESALDLIICDMSMPKMDGPKLIHQLGLRGRAAPMILATGAPHAMVRAGYVLANRERFEIAGVVAKPIDWDALVRLVVSVLERRKPDVQPARRRDAKPQGARL